MVVFAKAVWAVLKGLLLSAHLTMGATARLSDGATLPFLAAQACNQVALQLLLEAKQDMAARRCDGTTPLLIACERLAAHPQAWPLVCPLSLGSC